MSAHAVLWVYIILLEAGGLMGFLKAGSRASLIASSIFALVLALCALGILPFKGHLIVLAILLLFFGRRFAGSRKLMPNGLMAVLTIAALIINFILTR